MSLTNTTPESRSQFEVRLPEHFEPLEIDTAGVRFHEARLNDFEKHEVLNPILRTALANLDSSTPPDRYERAIVEVGSWAGANAIAMHQGTGAKVYCIDTWQGGHDTNGITGHMLGPRVIFQVFCANCRDYLYHSIVPCPGHSETYAPIWPFQVPAVFIDADHTYESCKQDIAMWWPHVAPGGVLVAHDYQSFADVKRACDEFGMDTHVDDLAWKWKKR